jgi:hypothetical protein
VVSLIARTRLSELGGLAFVVDICRRGKRRTRAGGFCRGAHRRGPVICPMKLRTPLKRSERNSSQRLMMKSTHDSPIFVTGAAGAIGAIGAIGPP